MALLDWREVTKQPNSAVYYLTVFAQKLRASRQVDAGLLSELFQDGLQSEMSVGVKDFIGPLRYALTGERVREYERVYGIC